MLLHRALTTGLILVLFALSWPHSALAAPATSKCLAVAENLSPIMRVAYTVPVAGRGENTEAGGLANNEVRITYVSHSTFLIESPNGVRIATDYAGWFGKGAVPDVVTMNHAHDSHYTDTPEPEIKYVLRGWNPKGGWAEYNLTVSDVYIRNVPTNIRTWGETGTEKFGNSVFIFELSGLCIGHLGHLHHELTPQQLGQIGQLDVVMVAVDGVFTLDFDGVVSVLKELRPRIVIPMHFFGDLDGFADRLSDTHDIEMSKSKSVVLSPATMPRKKKLLVLPGY